MGHHIIQNSIPPGSILKITVHHFIIAPAPFKPSKQPFATFHLSCHNWVSIFTLLTQNIHTKHKHMKTLLLAAITALTSLSASANNKTAQKKVNITVVKAFESEFGEVQDVSWSNAAQNMLRANFTKDDEKISAFFNQAGEYIATTIERKASDLPAKLKAAINQKIKDCVIIEALEFIDDDEEAYFVKVYNNGTEKLYKGTALGLVQEVKF
jgi:hypothetical protein